MANIFAHSIAIQKTSSAMLTTVADIFTQYGVRQSTPTSATIVTTPPVFTGIISSAPYANGSFLINYPLATGPNAPYSYQIYAALGVVSAATLFQDSNLVDIGKPGSTQMRIWTLGNQVTYFVNGLTYTFGVRAKDGVQNQNTNLTIVTATAIGSGNLTGVLQTLAVDLANTEIDLSADHVNFQADHTDFQADHTDFQVDHSDFQNDHLDFQADHTDFQADHTAFQGDHTNLAQDHIDFQADHIDFQADHANFVVDDAAFDADHVAFVDIAADMDLILSTASAGLDISANIATDYIELRGVIDPEYQYEVVGVVEDDITGII